MKFLVAFVVFGILASAAGYALYSHPDFRCPQISGLSVTNLSIVNADTQNGAVTPVRSDPAIFVTIPDDKRLTTPCLRADVFATKPETAVVYLPDQASQSEAFAESRTIRLKLSIGENSIAVPLPEYVKGRKVRIDPVDSDLDAKIRRIELGNARW